MTKLIEALAKLGPVQSIAAAIVVASIAFAVAWVIVKIVE